MTHTPHELAEEFPAEAARIQQLRQTDPHFARLTDEYHEVNRAVHRAETRIEPMHAAAEDALRHRRVHLKDEILRRLQMA